MENTIVRLIPNGYDNAISRTVLVELCVLNGLIDEHSRNKDRIMRNLIEDARKTNVIVSRKCGGYYIPTLSDKADLERYVKAEQSRAIKTFGSVKLASKYLETIKNTSFLDNDSGVM